MISRNEKFSYSCSLDFLSYLFLVSFTDVGPDFSSSIIRSSGQKSESSGSVVRQLRKGPPSAGETCAWGCRPLEGGDTADCELCSPPALPQPSSCHPLQFSDFPFSKRFRLGEDTDHLLLQSGRPPAPPLPSGRHLRGWEWRWVLLRRFTVPSPGAPGPRSQCGYPPGVAGTDPSPFLTSLFSNEEGVQRQHWPGEQHRTTTLQAAVGRWVYSHPPYQMGPVLAYPPCTWRV